MQFVCFILQNGSGGGGGPQVHQQQEAADPWVCTLTHSAECFAELERANEGGAGQADRVGGGLESARVQRERGYTLKEAIEGERECVCVRVCSCVHANCNFSPSWSQERPLSSLFRFFFSGGDEGALRSLLLPRLLAVTRMSSGRPVLRQIRPRWVSRSPSHVAWGLCRGHGPAQP